MKSERIVIIGAVALGPKVACRFKRLAPEAHVTMIDMDEHISYGGCGMPYYISGDVSEIQELMSTSFHMVRTPDFFETAKGVAVRPLTQALAIDRKAKTVRVRDLRSGAEEDLPYDRLVIATGASPNRLPIPGADLPGVMSLSNIGSAMAIKERLTKGEVGKAVIIGAGAIGCEMAEALADLWGIETTVVEIADQVLPIIVDSPLARILRHHMEEKGVTFHLGETVREIRACPEGSECIHEVVTSAGVLPADLVVTAVGVRPNGALAREAGLLVSPRGAVVVNDRMETSDPAIYAGGDCIEVRHLVTGKPVYFPQGSLANRQGRIIGTNLAGGTATFPGVVGSFAVKVFEMAVASTGLSLFSARREGFDAIPALVTQADRAHFFPTQDLMYFQLVVDRRTRRVLGAQAVGKNGDALLARVNAVAALLSGRPTVEDISNLEVAYTPPFASALDIVNAAGNVAENILDGRVTPIGAEEFDRCFLKGEENAVCLDVRGPQNAAPFVALFGDRWVNIPQETLARRMEEVPKGKRLIVVCNSGARSYEAVRQLEAAGVCDIVNLEGGVAVLKKSGMVKAGDDAETGD